MKNYILTLLFFAGLCLATLSCTSPQQQTAAQALAETVTAATRDGIVTEDEAKAIAQAMQVYVDAPGVNWAELGGTVLASLAAGFIGLRYVPNAHIVGKTEALALDKAAGIG